ncbi:MAG TPA: nucleotidyltransferase domain-containing protein, partial [Candidatus Binatia bacterium]|nr:nucleotidyltransferase domain-containing protein [Candidatus Binatia bacterium]
MTASVIDSRLHHIVAAQPYPLLFATISGAHLYGFPSPDSDYDLRGAHVLPLYAVVGLEVPRLRRQFKVQGFRFQVKE